MGKMAKNGENGENGQNDMLSVIARPIIHAADINTRNSALGYQQTL